MSLAFVDQSEDQIATVRTFLNNHGIVTGNVLRTSKDTAFLVAVGSFKSVREVLRWISPLLCKKAIEARAALDYYEGRISGDVLFAVFQREVEAGRRERRERKVAIRCPLHLF